MRVVFSLALVWVTSASVNKSQWMHDVFFDAQLGPKSILDITLPGTHDSASYTGAFQENFAPGNDDLLVDIVEIADKFGVDVFPLIESWATAQNMTLFQQLQAGARFLDLRACYSTPTEADPTAPTGWYSFHMILTHRIQFLLDQVAAFLGSTPGGEVVVLEVTHLYGSNASTDAELRKMLTDTLGEWLVIGQPFNDSLTSLTANATRNRVLVLLEGWDGDGRSTGLWPDALIEGQYADKDKVAPMRAWDQNLIETLGGDGKIFRLWWTLTENADDVVAGLLDPSAPQSLLELAAVADSQLQAWADANKNLTLGNLLVVDRVEDSPAVQIAVEDALRNCVDDAGHRARSPDGQDCRSWSQAGLCVGEGSKQDMVRKLCRRACLEC